MSFLLAEVQRRICRCSATVPLLWKRHFHAQISLFFSWGGGVENGFEARHIRLASRGKFSCCLRMPPILGLYVNSTVASRLKTTLMALLIGGCPFFGTDGLLVAQPKLEPICSEGAAASSKSLNWVEIWDPAFHSRKR